MNSSDHDGSGDLVRTNLICIYFISINLFRKIWHWTHTSEIENDRHNRRQIQAQKYMLITVPGIGEITNSVEP
jgi:hypothetical protein